MLRKSSVNRKIDLLSLLGHLPRKLKTEVDGDYITLTKIWYLKGVKRSCKIRVRRYVDGDLFSEFLGLYVADGSKKLDRVRFANSNIEYHKKLLTR